MSTISKKPIKIIVILGPTASGKSDLAVQLARSFNGEVVSADSRQVYRGLDIGTGKITLHEMRGVRHHLLDIVTPRTTYDVVRYRTRANRAIAAIARRNKLPIICGGTGYYIQAVIDGTLFPDTGPNRALRRNIANLSPAELLDRLRSLDPARAAAIDAHNPRRLIRALEIATAKQHMPHTIDASARHKKTFPLYDPLFIATRIPDEELRARIAARLNARLRKGMVGEVRRLHEAHISWQRLDALGLEYRYVAQYLQKQIDRDSLQTILERKIWQYARRQKTWFKRNSRIHWFHPKNLREIEMLIREFLLEKNSV